MGQSKPSKKMSSKKMSSVLRRQTSEWTTFDKGWSWVKHSVSDKTEGVLWFKDHLVVPKNFEHSVTRVEGSRPII
jgi:hypothetical protein